MWLVLLGLVAGAAGAVVYWRPPFALHLPLPIRLPSFVRKALKAPSAPSPQTRRPGTAVHPRAPSSRAPRSDQQRGSVAQAVRSYNDQAALFGVERDCAGLGRSLRAVEERWMAYKALRQSAGAKLDAEGARRDLTLYASVDSVERHFEASGCTRP